jgi:putative ATP-binding cassette transporter
MFTVGPIPLTFNSGEISFIVGGNGSGKTTLSKLLCGLYVSQNGAYAINGDCISPTQISTYRNQFSAIFSDFHLFESVIPANTHVPEHVNELIDLFQLRHKVTFENGRFSTQALSTGQRKRLALIVALLEDKPIYIFDEWASDQDPEFKQIFYEKILLDLKKRHKILIVITHDDHYFNCADRIIRLRNGQLSTDTTPKVSEKLRHLEVGLNR